MSLLGALPAWPLAVLAQSPGGVRRIGFLGDFSPTFDAPLLSAFREQLGRLGYAPSSFEIDYRGAEARFERFPALVTELLGTMVQIIVAPGNAAALAAKGATATIPVVMIGVLDPVGSGLVTSLKQPGGNITGLSSIGLEIEVRRLELLYEIIPNLSRVAVILDPDNPVDATSAKLLGAALVAMQGRLLTLPVTKAGDIDLAFNTMLAEKAEALLVLSPRAYMQTQERLKEFVARNRLPAIFPDPYFADSGSLLSFEENDEDLYRRAAEYVDKILKGAKPGELPIEEPVKFNLRVNLKAARAIGLKVPDTLLRRAVQVIE